MSLFGAASAQQTAGLPTASARTQQIKAAQVIEARQLAVTKGLQSLETALSKMHFTTSERAGDREEIREDQIRFATRDVYRTEAIVSREAVTATRALFEVRPLLDSSSIIAQRPVFETRDIVETRDVFETRDLTETRDITETQPVYTQQEIRETLVTGNRDLTAFNRISEAGISTGTEFSVTVGSDATAVVRFHSANRIRLTVNGTSTNFNFDSNDGGWRTALASALDSIANLTASIDADGTLVLETANAESLQLADTTGSPLDNIGLTPGTTTSSVVGYQQVQTGTEEVVIGTEEVVIGTEEVLVGTEGVVIGTEEVEVGIEDYVARVETLVVGEEITVTGTQTYISGMLETTRTQAIFDRTEPVDTGLVENVLVGFRQSKASAAQTVDPVGRRAALEAVMALDNAIGRASASNPFSGLRPTLGLDTLARISTTAERDAALTKVRTALDSFAKSTAGTPIATLVQANIALGQGSRTYPPAYGKSTAVAPSLGILV